jgi:hypothetical protein
MYLFTKKVLEIEPTKWYKTHKNRKKRLLFLLKAIGNTIYILSRISP